MKNQKAVIVLIIFSLVLTIGCNKVKDKSSNVNSEPEKVATEIIPNEEIKEKEELEADTRTRKITDLTGEEMEIPIAEDIDKVVILSPYLSFHLSIVQKPETIIGASANIANSINKHLVEVLLPNIDEVRKDFASGKSPNAEELISMNPDIIIGHKTMTEGLDNIGIPFISFDFLGSPEEVASIGVEERSLMIDHLMREIFGIEDDGRFKKEWGKAHEIANEIMKKHENEEKQKCLYITSNDGEKLRAFGANASELLTMSGVENVVDIQGRGVDITMEHIYNWNPDIIYTWGKPVPAKDMLQNLDKGHDWSHVNAFKTGRIYDVPRSFGTWHNPTPDSPLTMLWMISKNFPDDLPEEEFIEIMKTYYKENHNMDISTEVVESIIYPWGK